MSDREKQDAKLAEISKLLSQGQNLLCDEGRWLLVALDRLAEKASVSEQAPDHVVDADKMVAPRLLSPGETPTPGFYWATNRNNGARAVVSVEACPDGVVVDGVKYPAIDCQCETCVGLGLLCDECGYVKDGCLCHAGQREECE